VPTAIFEGRTGVADSGYPDGSELVGSAMPTGMVWGIKDSFLAYLRRMPDLWSSATEGAVATRGGGYYFPTRSVERYDSSSGLGVLEFGGDVRFKGHHGMLCIQFAHPWIVFGGDMATLTVAYASADGGRLPLLDLTVAGWSEHYGARAWPNVPTRLRPEALEFFDQVYPAGEPFAPVDIRVVV
jgi:Htaa